MTPSSRSARPISASFRVAPEMSPLTAWLAAIRPRTLGLSVSPVLLGTAQAFAETGRVHAGVFLATLLAALLIQIGTNLHNDVADFLRGTDTPERLGPVRATAQGWLSPQVVSRAAVLAFALALVTGLFLAWVGGWPIVVLGLVSLAAGAAYSGGPWPLSSLPVGELFVFLFFGVVAVAGSHYLQTGYWSPQALLGGAVLGLPAATVLLVNNFRDRHGDARAGRRTLAILLLAPGSHRAYAVMILAPFALLPGLLAWPAWLLPMLLLPRAWRLAHDFWHAPDGQALNPVLVRTARFQFWLGVSIAVSLWPGIPACKRVFDSVKDFGISQSPKSTRSSTVIMAPAARRPRLKVVDMFRALDEGRIRAIWIMGTNPAVTLPDSNRVRREGRWHYELAGEEAPQDWAACARRMLIDDTGGQVARAELFNTAVSTCRAALFDGERLEACIFIGPDFQLSERDWLVRLFAEMVQGSG